MEKYPLSLFLIEDHISWKEFVFYQLLDKYVSLSGFIRKCKKKKEERIVG